MPSDVKEGFPNEGTAVLLPGRSWSGSVYASDRWGHPVCPPEFPTHPQTRPGLSGSLYYANRPPPDPWWTPGGGLQPRPMANPTWTPEMHFHSAYCRDLQCPPQCGPPEPQHGPMRHPPHYMLAPPGGGALEPHPSRPHYGETLPMPFPTTRNVSPQPQMAPGSNPPDYTLITRPNPPLEPAVPPALQEIRPRPTFWPVYAPPTHPTAPQPPPPAPDTLRMTSRPLQYPGYPTPMAQEEFPRETPPKSIPAAKPALSHQKPRIPRPRGPRERPRSPHTPSASVSGPYMHTPTEYRPPNGPNFQLPAAPYPAMPPVSIYNVYALPPADPPPARHPEACAPPAQQPQTIQEPRRGFNAYPGAFPQLPGRNRPFPSFPPPFFYPSGHPMPPEPAPTAHPPPYWYNQWPPPPWWTWGSSRQYWEPEDDDDDICQPPPNPGDNSGSPGELDPPSDAEEQEDQPRCGSDSASDAASAYYEENDPVYLPPDFPPSPPISPEQSPPSPYYDHYDEYASDSPPDVAEEPPDQWED